MTAEGSVSKHIDLLKSGDHAAARHLWQRYFGRLVRLARRKLPHSARRAADEEDVALAAFMRFCQRAEQGRLPAVRNRDDLWRILVTLTVRMAIDQVRGEERQKRGGRTSEARRAADPDQLAGRDTNPEFIVQVAEECQRRLAALDDEELKLIAVWKTEGYTNEEIASELGCVLRTVERKVQAIRRQWTDSQRIDDRGDD
jgi:DNA-directed RNA polymerase specialized sigma24 family protein